MLTVNEASAKLGISRTALYAAMATGKLKYVEKYGKRLLYERSVEAYNPRTYPRPRQITSAATSEQKVDAGR